MIPEEVILVLASLGFCQGVLLSFYFLTRRHKKKKDNLFLGLLILGLTIRIGKTILNYYTALEPWQRVLGNSGILWVGPCLWFYGQAIIKNRDSFSLRDYLHFLPVPLSILLPFIFPNSWLIKGYWDYSLPVFHLGGYLIISIYLLIGSKANISPSVFRWYQKIVLGTTVVFCFYLGNFLNLEFYYITGPIFFTFLVSAFTFLLLNRKHQDIKKYSSSNLDRKTSKELYQNLLAIFKEEKLFLEPNLSLHSIAERLMLSSRNVSQIINENGQQNFHEFVNQHRIERAKKALRERKNEKMAAIAYDSGFGNVTSFNVAFKKSTGLTPSEYKRKYLKT